MLDTKLCSVINGGLSEISGAFPVPPPRDSRERNGKPGHREEATGTPAIRKRPFPSITVIGAMSIIVTTLSTEELFCTPVPLESLQITFRWVGDSSQVKVVIKIRTLHALGNWMLSCPRNEFFIGFARASSQGLDCRDDLFRKPLTFEFCNGHVGVLDYIVEHRRHPLDRRSHP